MQTLDSKIPGTSSPLVTKTAVAQPERCMPKKILLVDDEFSIRDALSKILRAENYEVELAKNGQEALEKQEAGPSDLVVLDLNLPVKNGWEILDLMVKSDPLLPVIIITGRSYQGALAQKAGADALMEKPLDVPQLLCIIRELLEEPLEKRILHAADRTSRFRYAPCDNQLLRGMLLARLMTPYVFAGKGKQPTRELR
jgi:DNA-binding response OmpR family regulator